MKKLRVLLLAILACICLYSLYACSLTGGKIPEANGYALSVNHTKDDPNREWGDLFDTPVKKLTIKSAGKDDRVYTVEEYGTAISDFTNQSIKVGDKVSLTVVSFFNEEYQENSSYQQIDTFMWYLTKVTINDDIDIPIEKSNTGEFTFSFEVLEQDYSVFLTYDKEQVAPELPKTGTVEIQENQITGSDARGSVSAKIIKRAQLDNNGYFIIDSSRLPILDTLSTPIEIVAGETEVREGDVIEFTVTNASNYYMNRIIYNGGTTRINKDTGIIPIAQQTGALARVENAVLIEAQDVDANNAKFVVQVGKDMPIFGVRFTEGTIASNPTTCNVTWVIDEYNETSSEVAYGEVATYEGEVPTKADDSDFGYVFAGWSTDPNATEPETLTAVTTETITYYAVFTKTAKYVVKFYNGTTELQSGKVTNGQEAVFTGTNPTKDPSSQYDYTFIGWSTNQNATEPDAKLIVDGETNFYAIYSSSPRMYNVTWISEGSTFETTQVAYNTAPVAPASNPTKNGSGSITYTFKGWSTTQNGEVVTSFDKITSNLSATTFYAVYYTAVDGVVLDGERDTAYGSYSTIVELLNDGSYTVSAIKTNSGVIIYTQ